MAADPHPEALELLAGQRLGPYTIEAPLGEGGMGHVYRAIGADGGPVALKLIKPELVSDSDQRRRFEREARVATRVEHPHVVRVLDVGEQDGFPYMAQQLISGGSLHDRIGAEGPLELESTVKLCLEVASGLGALHQVGLVHRDLKPANILLDGDRRAYITDFGLAKDREASVLTKPGQAVGSMDYMAPEQIRAQEVSAVTDVYALGCVMCECLRGEPPFADRRGMQVLWAHLQDEPPDPCERRDDLPDGLSWAVLRALEKEPERRPPSATAYARMIQVAAGVPPLSPGADA